MTITNHRLFNPVRIQVNPLWRVRRAWRRGYLVGNKEGYRRGRSDARAESYVLLRRTWGDPDSMSFVCGHVVGPADRYLIVPRASPMLVCARPECIATAVLQASGGDAAIWPKYTSKPRAAAPDADAICEAVARVVADDVVIDGKRFFGAPGRDAA